MRYHNYIAEFLGKENKKWDDERIFQEARHIVGATLQNIVYNEFLPHVIGPALMDHFDLWVRQGDNRTAYNSQIEPTLTTEFATAPFRFGHSLIQILQPIWGKESLLLRDTFFQPFRLYDNVLANVMKGSSQQKMERFDSNLIIEVRGYLYRRSGAGLDLASLNIARGRDHGLAPYVDYVHQCLCKEISGFDDLADIINKGNLRTLKKTYADVKDIDLFAGGLSEKPVPGGIVGPTFACIIAREFRKLKFGDRFYFEHADEAGSFTNDQVKEIRKMTLSKILCIVTNMESIQKWSLRIKEDTPDNKEENCSDLTKDTIDFSHWS